MSQPQVPQAAAAAATRGRACVPPPQASRPGLAAYAASWQVLLTVALCRRGRSWFESQCVSSSLPNSLVSSDSPTHPKTHRDGSRRRRQLDRRRQSQDSQPAGPASLRRGMTSPVDTDPGPGRVVPFLAAALRAHAAGVFTFKGSFRHAATVRGRERERERERDREKE